jgi:hypothetical protein
MKFRIFLALVMLTGAAAAADGFTDVFDLLPEEEEAALPGESVSLRRQLTLSYRWFFDEGFNGAQGLSTDGTVTLEVDSGNTEARGVLLIRSDEAGEKLPQELSLQLDELFLRTYLPFGYADIGLLKTEWGPGDTGHAADPLSPLSYNNGFPQTLIAAKQPELTLALHFYLGKRAKLETIVQPWFHPISFASSGRWAVADLASLPGLQDPPDTETWEYAQAAVRLSGSTLAADGAVSWYYGRMPEPGYRITSVFTGSDPYNPADYTITTDVVYTKAHMAAAEATAAICGVTLKGEAGLYISEDREGTAAHLYNSRVQWLAGADLQVPGINLFLLAEWLGSYVFSYSSLTADEDVDLQRTYGSPLVTTVTAAAETDLFRERLKLRLSGTWLVEAGGYAVMPAACWKLSDRMELALSGVLIGSEDQSGGSSPFYAWRDNDSVTLAITMR